MTHLYYGLFHSWHLCQQAISLQRPLIAAGKPLFGLEQYKFLVCQTAKAKGDVTSIRGSSVDTVAPMTSDRSAASFATVLSRLHADPGA